MRFDGMNWRRSTTVVTLPEYKDGVYVQFGRICTKNTPGAVMTNWKIKMRGGPPMSVYAKPIEGTGYGLTCKMYGRPFVRDGEVRVRAYLAHGGCVYTTSWVHEEKTAERRRIGLEKRLSKNGKEEA